VQDSQNTAWDKQALSLVTEFDFVIMNKSDLGEAKPFPALTRRVYNISASTREGLDEFVRALEKSVINRFQPNQHAGLTRARHRNCIERAVHASQSAVSNLSIAPELAGEDIRRAMHALKELAGEMDIENVFDRIFSKFCVGK